MQLGWETKAGRQCGEQHIVEAGNTLAAALGPRFIFHHAASIHSPTTVPPAQPSTSAPRAP
jgi:hypothetical protein